MTKNQEMTHTSSDCANCPYKASDRLCKDENGKAPPVCPTRDKSDLVAQSLKEYQQHPNVLKFACQAAIQESSAYSNKELGYSRVRPSQTRIEEIMGFADRMKYKKLGLAFCIGLRKESKVVEKIFSSNGFDLVSVICKAGRISKDAIGVKKGEQLDANSVETMCNPIFQAQVLNEEQTDFNVLVGLCVGHDSLFFKHSDAPCTVLAVKDRLLGHNPLAAIYTIDSYYRSLKV